jgi:hypothetical protein
LPKRFINSIEIHHGLETGLTDVLDLRILHNVLPHGNGSDPEGSSSDGDGDKSRNPSQDAE